MTKSNCAPPKSLAEIDPLNWLECDSGSIAPPSARPYAAELECALWRGFSDQALPWLNAILERGPPRERGAAGWALARWHFDQSDIRSARIAIEAFHEHPQSTDSVSHAGPYLLAIQLMLAEGEIDSAQTLLKKGIARFGDTPDFALAKMLIARANKAGDGEVSRCLAELYDGTSLEPVCLMAGREVRFDRLSTASSIDIISDANSSPLVSVIVPVFNGGRVLSKALSGLMAQTWTNLEILVVDDGSNDETAAVAQNAAKVDNRIRVIQLNKNQGAYAARNEGFAQARGAFVTVHDADDWSHPRKIECQARALVENSALKASISHWVRAGDDLEMTRWRIEEGWIFRNVSSLMIRVELREELGFWDRTRVNADTEYYYRILAAYGSSAIEEVQAGSPLAFGRTLAQSLTNQSATHVRTQYSGVRHDYMEAAHLWHSAATSSDDLHLPQHPTSRPFHAPDAIALDPPSSTPSAYSKLTDSGFLDEAWYLIGNPDVLQSDIGAVRHYLLAGANEGRDPGPEFSTGGYRLARQVSLSINPLLDFMEHAPSARALALPSFEGAVAKPTSDAPCALVFAHTSGETLFGAERSLLDVVRRLVAKGRNPVVVLPILRNPDYVEQLKEISVAVETLPQFWRNGLRTQPEQTVKAARALIRKHGATEVHVNTVMLQAPLIAARAEGVPSVLYVREMPAEDKALCRAIGLSASVLREQILEEADRFIMPSQVAADWVDNPDRCTVRPNAVDEALFELPYEPGEVLRVGLISSNIAKKGIKDAVDAARLVAARGWPVHFYLIGPQTHDIDQLGLIPPNVVVCGYAASPIEAIERCDIVLSLSHFAESFGRTVMEAMAAGRPVICYDRGAPPSLVISGTTGFVVAADSPQAVSDAVLALHTARVQLRKMSDAARERARELQRLALS